MYKECLFIYFLIHVHKEDQKQNNNKLFHRIFILLKFTCVSKTAQPQSDYASSSVLIIFHRNNLNRRPANKLPILMPFIIILFESEVPLLELEIYRIRTICGAKQGRKWSKKIAHTEQKRSSEQKKGKINAKIKGKSIVHSIQSRTNVFMFQYFTHKFCDDLFFLVALSSLHSFFLRVSILHLCNFFLFLICRILAAAVSLLMLLQCKTYVFF